MEMVKAKRQVSVAEYRAGDVVDRDRGEEMFKKCGALWHVKPLPSLYRSPLAMCAEGRRRKVNRELNQGGARDIAARANRLYFDSRKGAGIAVGKGARIAFAPLGAYHGRGLWLRLVA
jgi:hypothetical protein